MERRDDRADATARAGLFFGLSAHALWGCMPLYFAALGSVSPLELLFHRIVWSGVLLVVLLSALGRWGEFAAAVRDRRAAWLLVASTVLIAINWFVFLYAVSSKQVTQSSLGYFTNPLFNVLLGVLVLGERLRPAQWVALALAAVGVIVFMLALGALPWIALVLACSFAVYGLVRKVAAVDGLVGLSVETFLLTPLSAGLIAWWVWNGQAAFLAQGAATDGMLVLSGPATVVPLLCFVLAARRLPLSTLGFLQYIGPTLQLLTAVFVFKERFGVERQVTFGLIWAALALVVIDSVVVARRRVIPAGPPPPAGSSEEGPAPRRTAVAASRSSPAT